MVLFLLEIAILKSPIIAELSLSSLSSISLGFMYFSGYKVCNFVIIISFSSERAYACCNHSYTTLLIFLTSLLIKFGFCGPFYSNNIPANSLVMHYQYTNLPTAILIFLPTTEKGLTLALYEANPSTLLYYALYPLWILCSSPSQEPQQLLTTFFPL